MPKAKFRSRSTEAGALDVRRAQMKEILEHIQRVQDQTGKILALIESDSGKRRPRRRTLTTAAVKKR